MSEEITTGLKNPVVAMGTWDTSPNSFVYMNLFHDQHQHLKLQLEHYIDELIAYEDLVSLDDNPELCELWNWNDNFWNPTEVNLLIDWIEQCQLPQ